MAVAKRELGRTTLQVTTWAMGRWTARGAARPRHHETQAEAILNKVLDAGINYIDTSIDYGLSEERIGRYISHRRAEYHLASKCGCLVGAPRHHAASGDTRLHPRQCRGGSRAESCADEDRASRRRAVPRLAFPADLEERGALEALLELREAGKVRFIGMSGTLPHLMDHIAMGVFDVFQIPYSAVERETEA